MKNFSGKVLFLDRSDINTDEIIPAKYLTESTREALKPYLLEDLKLVSFDPKKDIAGKSAVITRNNFGCGSSREHAPWALEMNGINIVIASGFARIFRQNMYNCGMIACRLDTSIIDEIFKTFAAGNGFKDTDVKVDSEKCTLALTSGSIEKKYPFTLAGFERSLVQSGGWVEYAANNY
ncbi:MAG: 3-isopropylmalate dehydratase small subunit [Termitinemataceae bacterium]|nr:MAG: 3-isopropylmalate dehydratase small subunit [Termitinemataceae bacterium]